MNIKIYQIYYQNDQQNFLDINFTPYSNILNNNPDWREYWVFKETYDKCLHKQADFTGFISWRFNEKTRIDGKRFIDFINTNLPNNYDVYFINPLPWDLDCFDNIWLQGDYYHKGILDFTQHILAKCGVDINLREIVHREATGAYCNYWVGNQYFWDEYMNFTLPVYKYLSEDLSEEERDFLYSDSNYHISTNYIPFIMERMFSTLLSYNKNIKALGFKYTSEEIYRLTLNNYRVVRDNYYCLEQRIDDYEDKIQALTTYANDVNNEAAKLNIVIEEQGEKQYVLQEEISKYQSEIHRLQFVYEELLEQDQLKEQEIIELKQTCEIYKNSPAVKFSNELSKYPSLKILPLYYIL
ncbi:MAG: hypothetical protein HC808_02320 [Candidatus Competibacteraceae bacterium]|nr:hypothetical protein [Candidatus Competibacteraceae bacterium]